ncbi:phosphocholine-specific phospholipase C [Chitinophaga flava]|uniref:phospholipase C n=1 Tax=Chitinophaga flava TaxID=2259036 RepID=A0A365Y1L4_9BACT|nr:phospholipase C, phosphocholine-specific [Chitinophaga flava]RBL91824.1 phospholipase C, phosphocholine-specific [Chitinophaga flava]
MDTRRDFLKKSLLLSGAAGFSTIMPASIQKALAIDPTPGSTWLDAEHIVILMQENRSFDHCFGTLQGVRGFNDPRAIPLPNLKPVWFQTDDKGDTYAPFRLDIKDTKITWMGSLPHSRASQVDAYNTGKHDQWLIAKRPGNKQYAHMPLTLGYFTREDLPFNYAMADAFTICDQHFCSGMTSTTPNRSFFWTGKITSKEDGRAKVNIRNDDFSYGKLTWKTFPEMLEENNVSWKFYQNDLSCGGGFKGEERAWLANFGCNLLEFFEAYHVKFSSRHIQTLLKQVDTLPDEINKLMEATPSSDEAARKIRADIAKKQEVLDNATKELLKWNKESFDQLSDHQKNLYKNAFVINSADPNFRTVTTFQYTDDGNDRKVTVPAGDILYQFRKDVQDGKLPAVSWLAGPQNFSDHPSAPWYGAWYVSEIMDILTSNPEVWKKTIFIVTYDENDGYFDHVPPFSIPDENKPETGKCSAGIDTEVEHVRLENELLQGIHKKQAREAPIGLGFRVPLIIASPWSRGGKVCSQVFDHTSTLQFLETYVNRKYGKKIHVDNISQWRRTICGDLTAVFSPFTAKTEKLPFLNKEKFVQHIYNAQFKAAPGGFKKITDQQLERVISNPEANDLMAPQEKGVRPSPALPYELYADAQWLPGKQQVEISFAAGNTVFGSASAGAPFTVFAPVAYKDDKGNTEVSRNWSFAVKAGDSIRYQWPVTAFEAGTYHLHLHGPNGFFRAFKGNHDDPAAQITCTHERNNTTGKLTGNVIVNITGTAATPLNITIRDNAYKNKSISRSIAANGNAAILLPLQASNGWYDFSILINGFSMFERRYAGRVETGKEGITDPYMGRAIS